MTKQEAIIHIEKIQPIFNDDYIIDGCDDNLIDEQLCEAIGIATECIEKQIPKKPIIEYMPLFKAYCPICDGRLLPSKWCAKCGQAILWESDNE